MPPHRLPVAPAVIATLLLAGASGCSGGHGAQPTGSGTSSPAPPSASLPASLPVSSTTARTPPPPPAHPVATTTAATGAAATGQAATDAAATGATVTATATPAAPPGSPCTSIELRAALQPGSPGAGQRYATLVLTNVGPSGCTVTGYGGVGLVDASGHPVVTHQVRAPSPAPVTVHLAPGASASSQLHWGAVAGTGDATSGDCEPTASALQVIPPGETHPLSVPWDGGPVCELGRIDQQAYVST